MSYESLEAVSLPVSFELAAPETDIPSAAPATPAAGAAGETDDTTGVRRRRPRWSTMPAYEHESLEPSQWVTGRPLQPEKRLMLAVLGDALDLLLRPPAPPHSRRAPWQRDAARWIRSDDQEWPYSFVNICDALSLEPHRIREYLERGIEERRKAREASEAPPSEPTATREPHSTDDSDASRPMPETHDPVDTRDATEVEPFLEFLPQIAPTFTQPWPWL